MAKNGKLPSSPLSDPTVRIFIAVVVGGFLVSLIKEQSESAFRFLICVAFLVGFRWIYLRSPRLKQLPLGFIESLGHESTSEEIDAMSGHEFEEFVSNLFVRQGFKAEVTKRSGDQGADIILQLSNRRIVVQTKRYSTRVGNWAIQEIVASKKFYKATEAIVVTTSEFTAPARSLADANGVQLIDRSGLMKLVREHHQMSSSARPYNLTESFEKHGLKLVVEFSVKALSRLRDIVN